MRYRQRLTEEEKIRRLILRRRRNADRAARRRAEAMLAKAVDVSRDEILERDGNLCSLCGKEMSVHDMTLEHVIPLIKGGEHTHSNIRLAHRVCNSKKGARALAELDF